MKKYIGYGILNIILAVVALSLSGLSVANTAAATKHRILVISSYHPEYLWSQDTNRGVIAALKEFGYLDSVEQGEAYTRNDIVENSHAVIKKLWMDTKRKNSNAELNRAVVKIMGEAEKFSPDIILLGDDNAANLIGNQYIDTEIPAVFWGINGYPVKYGLIDSMERPGHNITGVYQAGYLKESLVFMKNMLPEIETFAVLSDNSETGRSKAKQLVRMAENNELPVKLIDTIITGSVETWKKRAITLQSQVDAFFMLNHNTLKNSDGSTVDPLKLGAWYLRRIKKPDVAHERQFVIEGILCAVDDSGFKQGYEAVRIAHEIITKGAKPSVIPVYAPSRGSFIVNRTRAGMLGLDHVVNGLPIVEEYVERSMAIDKFPDSPDNDHEK